MILTRGSSESRKPLLSRAFSRRFAPREWGGNSRDCHPGTNRRENQELETNGPAVHGSAPGFAHF
jgi:hypothetical protein